MSVWRGMGGGYSVSGWVVGLWIALVGSFVTAPRGLAQQRQNAGSGETATVLVEPWRPTERPELGPMLAQDGVRALRVEVAPAIDGQLDEREWEQAEFASEFVQQVPNEGTAASERTEVRILLDGDALYIGARLADSDAANIVARLARRDEDAQADWFYLFLDSYHDRRTAFGFGVSAAGVQRDLRVANDDRQDVGWDAVWESAVTRDSEGWTVEARIPLSQLRFNPTASDARWGLNFRRDIARKNESSHWAPVPQGTDRFVSLFGELRGVDDLNPGRRVEILPYTVGRLTREPGVGEDPFYDPSNTFGSIGASVRVGLGSSFTLSSTINPDFGQVEADPATVNLTAFEIFQDERRPFFVEGSDIFTLSFPFWPPFFYSRRIGRGPQGRGALNAVFQDRPTATTILGAVKLSGKTDSGWSLGVLDAVTGVERQRFADAAGTPGIRVVEPRTNYAVARIAKELRGGASGVGAMVTGTHRNVSGTEMDFLHDAAYGFGVDAFHRFGEGEYISNLSVLGSHVRGGTRAIQRTQRAPGHYFQRPDADHITYDPARTSLTGVSVSGRVQRVQGNVKWGLFGQATSPGYEINDLGFNPELDEMQGYAWARYEDFTPGRIFRSWSVNVGTRMQRGWFGEPRGSGQDAEFSFTAKNYWGGRSWLSRQQPSWTTAALRGGPSLRRPGRWTGGFSGNSDRRRALSTNANVFWIVEDDAGGHLVNVSANVTVRPSDRFDLRLGPTFSTRKSAWQYVGTRNVASQPVYLVGALERRTASLSARVNYSFSPTLTLQIYARPFFASGEYVRFSEVTDASAEAPTDRFRAYLPQELTLNDGQYAIDRDGDGEVDVTWADPDFNVASAQVNSVLRWEYRPGSTLFLVWTHNRDDFNRDPWALGSSLDRLGGTPGRNVFQLKISYWMGM